VLDHVVEGDALTRFHVFADACRGGSALVKSVPSDRSRGSQSERISDDSSSRLITLRRRKTLDRWGTSSSRPPGLERPPRRPFIQSAEGHNGLYATYEQVFTSLAERSTPV